MSTNKRTIIALVENKPGVLNRIASKFRQRGFNIESLAVGHSETPGLSRMTIVVDESTTNVEQMTKQLYKIIDVIKVSDISDDEIVARELALIKVRATPATRSEIIQIVGIFRGSIVDVGSDSMVIEITGDEEKIDSLAQLLRGFGIREMVRTGRVAVQRGGISTIALEEETEIKAAPSTDHHRRPRIGRYGGEY